MADNIDIDIDDRIRVALSTHTKNILKIVREERRNEWEKFIGQHKTELEQTMNDIFENMTFLNKFKKTIHSCIEQELRSQLSEKGLQETIRSITSSVTKDVFKGIIQKVVEEVVVRMNRKLSQEHKIAKELCYSIDANIRHTLMNADISHKTEQYIKGKMLEVIDEVAVSKLKKIDLIEDKSDIK